MAFDKLIINQSYKLTDSQWNLLQLLSTILEPFQTFQRLLEGDTYVTLSLVPLFLLDIYIGLQKSIDSLNAKIDTDPSIDIATTSALSLCNEMKKKFLDEFDFDGVGFPVYVDGDNSRPRPKTDLGRLRGLSLDTFLATALDPRTKCLAGVSNRVIVGEVAKTHRDLVWEQLLLKAITVSHNRFPTNDVSSSVVSQDGFIPPTKRSKNYDLMKILQQNMDPQTISAPADMITDNVRLELEAYRKEPNLPLIVMDQNEISYIEDDEESIPGDNTEKYSDPLLWWKRKAHLFPNLSVLAMTYLSIPATSASSERLFSQAGITIANDRSRKAPFMAEQEILLKMNSHVYFDILT